MFPHSFSQPSPSAHAELDEKMFAFKDEHSSKSR